MANHGIIGSIKIEANVIYANALVRIVEYNYSSKDIRGNDEDSFSFKYRIWKSEASYDVGDGSIEDPPGVTIDDSQGNRTNYFLESIFNGLGKTGITQAYAYLKAKDGRFLGFKDV